MWSVCKLSSDAVFALERRKAKSGRLETATSRAREVRQLDSFSERSMQKSIWLDFQPSSDTLKMCSEKEHSGAERDEKTRLNRKTQQS